MTTWIERSLPLAPLLAFAEPGTWGGEDGVLEKIFSLLPPGPGFAVEFGQRNLQGGTVAGLVQRRGWSALYMDSAVRQPQVQRTQQGATLTLARESVLPGNVSDLFQHHAVPNDLDCLVIDIDGLDYWVWQALDARYRPALVVIEFNAHVGFGVEATIALDDTWSYGRTRDYGASFAAFLPLAQARGYRLIHVHGCWNLYFLRADIPFPDELALVSPLDAAGLAQLTDTLGFYEALCGAGKRPSWIDAPAPDVSRAPWQLLADPAPSQVVDIDGLALEVLADRVDAAWYQQRKVVEERRSLLYPWLRDAGFSSFVDVGANVGLMSIVARSVAPGLRVVPIEADPKLVAVLRRNFVRHGMPLDDVHNALVGDAAAPTASFSLNPRSTLDNRVRMEGWPTTRVPALRLDVLLPQLQLRGPVFIKIDTQGFEFHVLRGLLGWAQARSDWLLKMEFAPKWLRSQGTEPMDLLAQLAAWQWEFAEYPERIAYGAPGLESLFLSPVHAEHHAAFLAHVQALNRDGQGWVDLIVRPRRGAG